MVALQFLEEDTAYSTIEAMQSSTERGGYNVIIAPINGTDFPCPIPFPGLCNSGYIQEIYRDWNIIEYNEMF